jgi:hypothetical protein
VGTTVYHHHHDHHPHYHYNDPTAADDPQYLDIYDEADETLYWDWEGQGEASFTLVYRHGDKGLQARFTFRRQKM